MTNQNAAYAPLGQIVQCAETASKQAGLKGRVYRFVADALRYGAASAAALIVDWGALAILTRGLGVNYGVAAPLSFSAGLVVVYTLSVAFIFKGRSRFSLRNEFLGFAVTGLIGLILNQILLFFLIAEFSLAPDIAKGPVAIIVFAANFLMRRQCLFTVK